MKPHTHCEVIKKWADGECIQVRGGNSGEWMDVEIPTWSIYSEYRVKPSTKEFRVANMRAEAGSTCINLCFGRENARHFERKPVFIKWLTDWIEVEV